MGTGICDGSQGESEDALLPMPVLGETAEKSRQGDENQCLQAPISEDLLYCLILDISYVAIWQKQSQAYQKPVEPTNENRMRNRQGITQKHLAERTVLEHVPML